MHRRQRVLWVSALVITLVMPIGAPRVAHADGPSLGAMPAQFISKAYTEGLGRLPTPEEWGSFLNYYNTYGCTAPTTQHAMRVVFTGAEFLGLPYDNYSRVLAFLRMAFNGDPDQTSLNNWAAALNSGSWTWTNFVEHIINSSTFGQTIEWACSLANYYWGTTGPPVLPVTTPGYAGTDLQGELDNDANTVVVLAQRAVFMISSTLRVPAGKTLYTYGAPRAGLYTLQARLVRAPGFTGPLVTVDDGGALMHVWVDGQRGQPANYSEDAVNVRLLGGNGTAVQYSRIDNTRGWTSVQLLGPITDKSCPYNSVYGNLVTLYSSEHVKVNNAPAWSDGISIQCEGARVESNQVVDASDVSIIIFPASPTVNQGSQVVYNTILSAGNSAFAAMMADGEKKYGAGANLPFYGATFDQNVFWTGPDTHFDIALVVGSRPWFGDANSNIYGPVFTNNSTPHYTRVDTAIAVSGAFNVNVSGNSIGQINVETTPCPNAFIGVDAQGYYSGAIQGPATAVTYVVGGAGCLTSH